MTDVRVDAPRAVSEKTTEELARLMRQVSTTAAPLTAETIHGMLTHDAVTLFTARVDDTIVGMLTLACFPTPTGVRAWIEDVVTDESARGRGVGSALVRAALARAHQHGARTVELTSRPDRVAANRLYARLGFERRESNVYRYTVGATQ